MSIEPDNTGSKQAVEISCVIPVRDHADQLAILLAGLRELGPQDLNHEIIVVDDHSSQNMEPVCRRYDAICLPLQACQGPAAARNAGAAKARGEILFFMDADIEYTAGVLERAKRELDADTELQALSFMNQAYDDRDNMVKNYGAAIEHYWFSALFRRKEEIAPIGGFTTRNGAVRRAAFLTIGGFNTGFVTNAIEDYDFSRKIGSCFKAAMVREPVIYHNFPAALTRLLRNHWVRVTLWVPYFLEHKASLDPVQTSRSEMAVRLAGAAAAVSGLMALSPFPGRWLWAIGALVSMAAYLWGVKDFLKSARHSSKAILFPVNCLALHWISSLVVTAGGAWGVMKAGIARLILKREGKIG